MTKQEMTKLHDVIIYNVNRMYFDHFVPANLDAAYSQFEQTKNGRNPITRASVMVGDIDGVTICRALWNEMSYNPLRFGVVSPFTPNGVESISDFCKTEISKDAPAFEVLYKVRNYMKKFVEYNCNSEDIKTHRGVVYISYVDGHGDENYKMLTYLRKMMHAIATQNLEDLRIKKYRTEMEKVVNARHPNGKRGNKPGYLKETTSAEISFEVSRLTGIELPKPKPVDKPITIIEPSLFDDDPVAKPTAPLGDMRDTFEDTEAERIEIETDKIWKAKEKVVSVDEYKHQEIEQNLTPLADLYQQECKKVRARTKQSKDKKR